MNITNLPPILVPSAVQGKIIANLCGVENYENAVKSIDTNNQSYKEISDKLLDEVFNQLDDEKLQNTITDFNSNFIPNAKLITNYTGQMLLEIGDQVYQVRKNPQTNKLEGNFPVDFNHDWQIDLDDNQKVITAWADLDNGFGEFTDEGGNKLIFHVDSIWDTYIAHIGQIVKVADDRLVEIYKNSDGSWGSTDANYKVGDFTFDEETPTPPYGLKKEDIPTDADPDLFGMTYEYEEKV